MQMAAGREHGQSDRSRYSSWMEADLKKREKYQGRAENSEQRKIPEEIL